jgi:hypothetical protein
MKIENGDLEKKPRYGGFLELRWGAPVATVLALRGRRSRGRKFSN